jgi:hypothetical protein
MQHAGRAGFNAGAARLVLMLSMPLLLAVTASIAGAQEVPCQGKAALHANGRIKHCRVGVVYRIGQHELPAGTSVHFSPSGQLTIAELTAEATIYGQQIPAEATLFFGSDGAMRTFWLHTSTVLRGYPLGRKEQGVGHMLYPNGKFRAIWLAEPTEIQGIPCASSLPLFRGGWHAMRLGAQKMTWFYDDGRLQQAMLSRDLSIQGHKFKRGDVIQLRRDGTLDRTSAKLDWQGWSSFPAI